MSVRLVHDDCLDAMERLAAEGLRVDAVVTDPPYHLTSITERMGSPTAAPIKSKQTGVYARGSKGFMGQKWDGGDIAFRPDTWRRVFELMKPGAHLVAFSATKTYHRMACAIEDAGFEIRDQIGWCYGSGFPHSHNLDGEWEGWGSHLKPAWEPIALARKPMLGSIADNMAVLGTGALNIDACRVPIGADDAFDGGGQSRNGARPETHHEGWQRPWMHDPEAVAAHRERLQANIEKARALGRWPANLVHDGSPEVLDAFAAYGERGARAPASGATLRGENVSVARGRFNGLPEGQEPAFHGDSGTAARFFYSAKADAEDRAGSEHPTVKPVDLKRWLVRMITPPGGLVLDPFAGTGTTGAAARAEGMQALLIEREDQYVKDICRRLGLPLEQVLNAQVAPRPVPAAAAGPLFAL